MNRHPWMVTALAATTLALTCSASVAQTFFFVGPAGGDFFDELNWNTESDGSGVSPGGDLIPDSTTGEIALDLVIDGDTVVAEGQVDFGTGSLTLLPGSAMSVTGIDNDLDINADSTFSLTDATLSVFDIANFEGTSSFSGGSVVSVTDDIAFQDNFIDLSIDGTSFTAFDNIYFDGFAGSISNATFVSGDRLGVRNNVQLLMTNVSIEVALGLGDVDDVFAVEGAGSLLTLDGDSTLVADSVEEGADLVLLGNTTAMMGAGAERIVFPNELLPPDDDESTITLASYGAELQVVTDILNDARPFLTNGFTGLTYLEDPSTWNVTDWNGTDAVTLRLVPEPVGMTTALLGLVALGAARRGRQG